MRVLVTGISGFVGGHVAARLLESGHQVTGVAGSRAPRVLEDLSRRHPDRFPGDAIRTLDVRDRAGLRGAVREVKPDAVVHLAGIAFAPDAERDPRRAFEINFFGTLNLLEAVRSEASRARVLLPTSGDVYGAFEAGELPLRETQPLRPVSPYGLGKAAADLAGIQFHGQHGLDVVRVRPFNHTGPGQSPSFVCSEFARAVAAAEAGTAEPVLRTGNLDVERDFHDVRDTVRAYELLLERGVAGEVYHLAAGRSVSVRSILERLVGESRVPIRVETDPAKLRPKEVLRVEVAVEKIRAATGWRAEIPIERTLDDLLACWRRTKGA